MVLIVECTELRAKNTQQERLLNECAPPDQDPHRKETQWTNTARTEATTATGRDTNSEMMSTITAVSAQWRTDTNANMTKIIDRILDLQGQGRFDSEALRRATEGRFHQTQHMNLNNSQYYCAYYRARGKQ